MASVGRPGQAGPHRPQCGPHSRQDTRGQAHVMWRWVPPTLPLTTTHDNPPNFIEDKVGALGRQTAAGGGSVCLAESDHGWVCAFSIQPLGACRVHGSMLGP